MKRTNAVALALVSVLVAYSVAAGVAAAGLPEWLYVADLTSALGANEMATLKSGAGEP